MKKMRWKWPLVVMPERRHHTFIFSGKLSCLVFPEITFPMLLLIFFMFLLFAIKWCPFLSFSDRTVHVPAHIQGGPTERYWSIRYGQEHDCVTAVSDCNVFDFPDTIRHWISRWTDSSNNDTSYLDLLVFVYRLCVLAIKFLSTLKKRRKFYSF